MQCLAAKLFSRVGHRKHHQNYIRSRLLACRHHILEIVLEAVVIHALGPSKGPDILVFERFQFQWQFVDRSSYQTAGSDADISRSVSGIASDVIAFANAQTGNKEVSSSDI